MKRINGKLKFIIPIIVLFTAFLIAQNVVNYKTQGGARWVIGGSLDVASGGDLDIESGGAIKIAGTAIAATAAELNILDDGLVRADFTEEALKIYGIPTYEIRAADLADMGISETAGDHYLVLAANVITLGSEVANNETETSISYFMFILPPEYVSAGDCKVRIKHWVGGAGTSNDSTVDFSVYEQTGNGAVGGDIVTTEATVTVEDAWTTTDFVVTATNLIAGDILIIKFTSAVIESATDNIQGKYDGFAVLLDIKG